MKKCLCWLLVMVMVAAMIPLTVFAEQADEVLAVSSVMGTKASPDALVLSDNTAEITAGASDGYYWSWTATGNGDLGVEISTKDGWTYNISNMTTGVSTDTHWSDDEEAITYDTIAVSAGDKILVMACTYDPASNAGAPAGSVNVFAWFEPAEVQAPVNASPGSVTYVNTATPTGYAAAEGDVTTWVDITEAHTAVLGSDGFYHLDSADGDIIIVKVNADNRYGVNLSSVVTEGRLKFPVYENGSIVRYDIANGAFEAYADAAIDGWVYLTADLIHIYQGYGEKEAWYIKDNPYIHSFYLDGIDFDPDTAWMLSCATVASAGSGEEAVKGDMDGDGKVDNNDVAHLLWYTLFGDKFVLNGSGDFTGDGVIDNNDVAYLLWHTLFGDDYPI